MPVRSATSVWRGDLKGGDGTVALGSGAFEGPYSFPSRFEEGAGTNPEELLGAAHAGCFSMALSNALAGAGFTPTEVRTEARVHLGRTDAGMSITKIELICRAKVPGIDAAVFATHAEATKLGCIVSRALAAVPVELDAALA
ncbi:MAG: OsmC family protein [bacterium]|nr:OsmC family protein [bacterium]